MTSNAPCRNQTKRILLKSIRGDETHLEEMDSLKSAAIHWAGLLDMRLKGCTI